MSDSPAPKPLTGAIPEHVSLEKWAERLELALRQSDLGFWDWNPTSGEVYYSEQWAGMLGFDADELPAGFGSWESLVHPDDRARVETMLLDHLSGRAPNFSAEQRLRTKAGGYLWILTEGRVVARDADGRPIRMVGTHRNIDRTKQAEERLRESENRFRSMLEAAPVCFGVTTDGLITYANPAFIEVTGWSVEDTYGRSPADLVHPDDREMVGRRMMRIMSGERLKPQRYRIVCKAGGYVPVEVLSRRALFQGRPSMVALFRDMRDQVKAEARIEEYQHRLRSLTSELSLAEERERRRIAADLHDGPVQSLGLAKIRLGHLEAALGKGATAEIRELRKVLDHALADARDLLFDLSPPVLYDLGFAPAVEWLAERISAREDLQVSVEAASPLEHLSQNHRIVLFQSVRELLQNTVKHAQANAADVRLARENGRVRIVVSDDGVGFDTRELAARPGSRGGYGLFSLRERIRLLEGEVEICSTPGAGTRVTLWV